MNTERNALINGLSKYGYALLRPESLNAYDGVDLVIHLIEQNDIRLLEGFPVVLKNLLNEDQRFTERMMDRLKSNPPSKIAMTRYRQLLDLSRKLYEIKQESPYVIQSAKNLMKSLTLSSRQTTMKLSIERLAEQYDLYANNERNLVDLDQKRELQLELMLSEFFTPKQKLIIQKRNDGQPLTKTEREYFYRVIRKRLNALASDDLCAFAKSACK